MISEVTIFELHNPNTTRIHEVYKTSLFPNMCDKLKNFILTCKRLQIIIPETCKYKLIWIQVLLGCDYVENLDREEILLHDPGVP